MRSGDTQCSACLCVSLPWKTALKKMHPNLYFTFQVTFQDSGSLVYFGLCIFMLSVFRVKNFKVPVKASRFSWFRVEFEMRTSGRFLDQVHIQSIVWRSSKPCLVWPMSR